MNRYRKRFWLLASGVAALAGYLDAVGFLTLNGLFVSFMSGNSTQLAVDLVLGGPMAAVAAGLVGAFVGGVIAGALAARVAGPARKPVVLLLVTILLAVAALLNAPSAVFVMAAAMGAANGVFQRDGEVSIGVTYMTGTLVKLGQRLAAAITGGARWAWIPHLLLWSALVTGAALGTLAHLHAGPHALWLATAAALILTIAAALTDRRA